MSKIAEKKALEAYPQKYDNLLDTNVHRRIGYRQGYDQAIQDFIEKAEMYLKTRVYYNMHPNNITTAIQEFENYMQNG